jgi:hypothetical protein
VHHGKMNLWARNPRHSIYVANSVPMQIQIFEYINGKTYTYNEFLRKPANA